MIQKRFFKNPILFGILFLFACMIPAVIGKAAEPVTIERVDYDTQTITLKVDSADTVVYYSDYKKKKWEMLNGIKDTAGTTITMDISWIRQTKDYELCFKTNKNNSPYSIFLPKQAKDFKVIFNKETGKLEYQNDRKAPIYWRKNLSTEWKLVSAAEQASGEIDELPTFYAKGATLYFRTGQTAGINNNLGARPSKECKLVIPKRTEGPALKIDGSKLTVTIPTNTIYAVDGGTEKEVSSSETIKLSEIAPDALAKAKPISGNLVQYPDEGIKEVSIGARTKGTSSKMESKTAITKVPKQKKAPIANNFVFKPKSKTSFTIELSDSAKKVAKDKRPTYEYAVTEPGGELDYTKASWIVLSDTKTASITKTTAPEGSKVYIREKTVAKGKDTEFALASAPYIYLVTSGSFAGSSSIEGEKKFSIVKGMELPNNWDFTIIPATETDVKSITYKGTQVDFVSYGYYETDKKIPVRITGISKLESVLSYIGRDLPLVVTLENGDKIEKGLYLRIDEATRVTKKTFNLIKNATDQKVEFRLTPASKDITVSSIRYEGIDIYDRANSSTSSSPYTIALDLTYIYQNCRESKLGEDVPVSITMSNGEILDDVIFINIKEIGNVQGNTVHYTWSRFQETHLAPLTLVKDTTATIDKVTWNGQKLEVKVEKTSTQVKITIEDESKQPLAVTALKNTTAAIVVHFSNGATVEGAYMLTIQ